MIAAVALAISVVSVSLAAYALMLSRPVRLAERQTDEPPADSPPAPPETPTGAYVDAITANGARVRVNRDAL